MTINPFCEYIFENEVLFNDFYLCWFENKDLKQRNKKIHQIMQFLFLFFFCRPRLYINWKWMFSCWTKLYEVKLYNIFALLSVPHPLKILSKENILHDKSYHIRLNQRTKHSYFIEKEKKKKRVAIVANYLRSVFWCVTCILTFLNYCRYL